ncbi:hypothetical protein E2C01_033544 [Portunus trituberculatus]|uniref:Uncharacterized protein n=1 Tax=Portunus trituberculatus TaxID=210409 RepID=A0A5B7EY71_PORTR|nr:hypothetical protein [Portunus trituberculatus]
MGWTRLGVTWPRHLERLLCALIVASSIAFPKLHPNWSLLPAATTVLIFVYVAPYRIFKC